MAIVSRLAGRTLPTMAGALVAIAWGAAQANDRGTIRVERLRAFDGRGSNPIDLRAVAKFHKDSTDHVRTALAEAGRKRVGDVRTAPYRAGLPAAFSRSSRHVRFEATLPERLRGATLLFVSLAQGGALLPVCRARRDASPSRQLSRRRRSTRPRRRGRAPPWGGRPREWKGERVRRRLRRRPGRGRDVCMANLRPHQPNPEEEDSWPASRFRVASMTSRRSMDAGLYSTLTWITAASSRSNSFQAQIPHDAFADHKGADLDQPQHPKVVVRLDDGHWVGVRCLQRGWHRKDDDRRAWLVSA